MMRSRILAILFFLWAGQAFAGFTETKRIFNRLVLAIGKNSVNKPTLKVVNDKNLIAVTTSTGEIRIGSQLITYCSRFGADSLNALASLLSHELVHYYKEHFWGNKYGSAYADSDWGKKISDLDTHSRIVELHETQADQLGFYYAFSAGYKTWRIAGPMLDSIYKWYHLNEEIRGYPSLRQRKEMAETSAAKFARLIPVFEMSNYLRVVSAVYQDDQQATLLDFSGYGYEHLFLENIQTAEMYNNIAVSKILKAQKYSTTAFGRLQLPLVLDETSMMYEVSKRRGGSDEAELEKFNEYMDDAKDNLEKALRLDPSYWPAAVNKSLVLLGQGDYGGSEFMLNSEAISQKLKMDKSISGMVSEIRGFLSYLNGDSVKSRDWFKAAIKSGSSTARANQQTLRTGRSPEKPEADNVVMRADTLEKWNGKMIYPALSEYATNYDNKIMYANGKAFMFLDSALGYKVLELRPNIGMCPIQKVKFACFNGDNAKTSRGIKAGSTSEELIVGYGAPVTKVPGTVTTYWIYPRQKMVVMVDQSSNKVAGWFYYLVK